MYKEIIMRRNCLAILTLMLLGSTFSHTKALAKDGDVYFCETKTRINIINGSPLRQSGNTFKFKWANGKITFADNDDDSDLSNLELNIYSKSGEKFLAGSHNNDNVVNSAFFMENTLLFSTLIGVSGTKVGNVRTADCSKF